MNPIDPRKKALARPPMGQPQRPQAQPSTPGALPPNPLQNFGSGNRGPIMTTGAGMGAGTGGHPTPGQGNGRSINPPPSPPQSAPSGITGNRTIPMSPGNTARPDLNLQRIAAQPPTTPTTPTVDPNDQMWNDIMSQHEAGLGDSLEAVNRRAAGEGLRAAEINASFGGGGMGGLFNTGQAQALLSGRQMELDARTKHQQQGLEMRMTHLQQLMQQAEAAKDRDLQERLQTMMNTTALELERIRMGEGPGQSQTGAGGDGGEASGDVRAERAFVSKNPEGQRKVYELQKEWEKRGYGKLDPTIVDAIYHYLYNYYNTYGNFNLKIDTLVAEAEKQGAKLGF